MQLRKAIWIWSSVYLQIVLCSSFVSGLQTLDPPPTDEASNINPNTSLNVNGSLNVLRQGSNEENKMAPSLSLSIADKEIGKKISMPSSRGRSIVSSLSEQATNFGKELLKFFRGSPPSSQPQRRLHLPHPSVLRPQPHFQRHSQKAPMPHFNPVSLGVGETDRVGPTFLGESFQGGFLPSKKIFTPNPIKSSSTSTVINSTKVILVDPKAPCDFYTDTLCIESYPYPKEMLQRLSQIELPQLRQMIAEVQQNANILVDGVTGQEEALYTYEHYYGSRNNNTHSYRDYGSDGGYVCPSDIRYAQLTRAKNANGKWKVIVNFDDFVQTVRLEKCLKPYSRCSYVFSYLNSECVQVYNFQRLVSWEQDRGFHVDIYKVPTSCSCHLKSSLNSKSARVSGTLNKRPKTTNGLLRNLTSISNPTISSTSVHPLIDQSSFPLKAASSHESPSKYHQMKPMSLFISYPQNAIQPKQSGTSFSQGPQTGIHNAKLPYFRRNYQDLIHEKNDGTGNQEKSKQEVYVHAKLNDQSVFNTPDPRGSFYQRERNFQPIYPKPMRPANIHYLEVPSFENEKPVNYNTNSSSEFIHSWNDFKGVQFH